uniref:Uncharacterized protein n=1 Tax=Anguilla anguilla TaxID=7936 RepID=A0A0E9WRX8_ANGAN
MVLTVYTVTTERLTFSIKWLKIINKNNHEMTLPDVDLNSVRGVRDYLLTCCKLFNLLGYGD